MRKIASLIGLGFLLVLSACASLENALPPQVQITDIRLLDGGFIVQELEAELLVKNPNNFDLPLEGLTFTLELNDQPFAEGFSNQVVTIPRLGHARIPIQATTTIVEVLQQIFAIGRRETFDYRIEGLVYLQGITSRTVPYERSGSLRVLPRSSGDEFRLKPI